MDACMGVVHQAVRYLVSQSARLRPGLTATDECPGDPWYVRCRAAVDAAALAGDMEATKTACRAWWTYALLPAAAVQADDAAA